METDSASERQTGRQKDIPFVNKRMLGELQFAAKVRVKEIVGVPSISARTVGDITSFVSPTNILGEFWLGGISAV